MCVCPCLAGRLTAGESHCPLLRRILVHPVGEESDVHTRQTRVNLRVHVIIVMGFRIEYEWCYHEDGVNLCAKALCRIMSDLCGEVA